MPSIARLAVSVTAQTRQYQNRMRQAGKSTKHFALGVHGATAALGRLGMASLLNPITAIAGAMAGAALGIKRLARTFEEFDAAMHNSLAIMGDVSKMMREDMVKAAIEAARTTRYAAKEAAQAYFYLASAGLSAEQSLKSLPLVAKFAQAGMFNMARATELLTDAQSALGLSVENPIRNFQHMVRVADVLVKANTLANATVEQFSEALSTKAAAQARVLGVEMEEVVAVLAAFADQGKKGAEAGTAFHIVLRDLTTKAIKNKAAFEDADVAVYDASGNLRKMWEIVGDLERALAGLSDKQKKATLLTMGFADRSIAATQSLLGMSEEIRKWEEALYKAGGTVGDVAAKQLTPFRKSMQRAKADMIEFAEASQPLVIALGAIVESLAAIALSPKTIGEALGEAWAHTFGEGDALDKSEQWEIRMQSRLAAVQEAARKAAEAEERAAKALEAEAEAAERLERARKDAHREQVKAAQEIVGGLVERLAALNMDPLERTLDALRNINVDPKFLKNAQELVDTINKVEGEQARAQTIQEITAALEKQAEAAHRTAEELQIYQAKQAGATKAQLEYIEDLQGVGQVDKILTDLNKQITLSIVGAEKLQVQRARAAGATVAQIKEIERLQSALRGGDIIAKREEAAKGVFEATRTAMEKYEAEIDRLDVMLKTTAMTWDTYSRAVRMARDELESTADAKTKTDRRMRAMRAMEVDLGQTAIAGVNVKASGKQVVHDPANDRTNSLLEQLVNLAEREDAGVAVTT